MTDPDHTKAAEKLLIAICGYRSNGEIDNLRVLPLIEAALLAAKRKGAVDALREAAGQVKDMGLGFGGVFDGGRTITLRALIAWLEKKADRIEGEND